VNSIVKPIFNESFAKKKVCRSHEQCTRPIENVKRSSQKKKKESETQLLNAKRYIQTDN